MIRDLHEAPAGSVHLDPDQRKVVARELQFIEGRDSLSLQQAGDALVRRARNDGSPAHALFDWSDARVAHKARVERAMSMIRLVRVVFHDEFKPPAEPKNIAVRISPPAGAKASPSPMPKALSGMMERRARRDLEAWLRRYDYLENEGDWADVFRILREKIAAEDAA